MTEEWIIDGLTENYVNILKKKYIEENGEKLKVGGNWRTSASNTQTGRKYIQGVVPENIWKAILAIWGEEPTEEDEVFPMDETDEPELSSLEKTMTENLLKFD